MGHEDFGLGLAFCLTAPYEQVNRFLLTMSDPASQARWFAPGLPAMLDGGDSWSPFWPGTL